MLHQSRNLEAAKVLAGSPLYERLRWFTDDWLRYDIMGDSLVVTDLRMGMPGNYSFRFEMARRDAAGQWTVIQPRGWIGGGAASPFDGERLSLIWRRILDQQPPLPLAVWAGHL